MNEVISHFTIVFTLFMILLYKLLHCSCENLNNLGIISSQLDDNYRQTSEYVFTVFTCSRSTFMENNS